MRPHIGGLHPRVIPKRKDSVWLDFRGRHDRFLEFLSEHEKQKIAHHRHHTHSLTHTRHTQSHTLSDDKGGWPYTKDWLTSLAPTEILFICWSHDISKIFRSCFCIIKVLRQESQYGHLSIDDDSRTCFPLLCLPLGRVLVLISRFRLEGRGIISSFLSNPTSHWLSIRTIHTLHSREY